MKGKIKNEDAFKDKISITNAELPIMKVLWENNNITSPEILRSLDGNKNTLKTLLKRLVEKGAISVSEINSRTYLYSYAISENDYINSEKKGFLERAFDGSSRKMLLNFIKEEEITKEDLEELLRYRLNIELF